MTPLRGIVRPAVQAALTAFLVAYPAAGLMDEGPNGCLDAGLWATCHECDQTAIFHSIGSYMCRPCGHYEGDHLIGEIEPSGLLNHWNIAHTLTRWTA